ncbi:SH3 domain-containing protein [Sandaracinobacter sp. RS1-74]|uniref:SH3 domain-containing protein n=1 Tax=Sandaracinobacteroides sayramensis TaxID=2913411 RepID=UPI001EDBFC3C|nr:SH3 domain-containing protein [Sandaracinobacteroides sayramensis]MCG2841637.1 SH3 domain-containing protein [Sandaracinobacteroides sayramensis]
MRAFLLLLIALLLVPAPALAQQPTPAQASQPTNKDALKNRSGLPVPRFASLRANKAHMRSGPGKEYPVTWTFVRAGTPLEVVAEWNIWRKVRDADGTEGWMDRAMLSGDRSIQITRQTRDLRARPDLSSPIVLRAEPGVVMRVTMCADRWCRVEGQGRSGYLLREQGFGVYPNETIG